MQFRRGLGCACARGWESAQRAAEARLRSRVPNLLLAAVRWSTPVRPAQPCWTPPRGACLPQPQVDVCAEPDVVRAVAARREQTVCVSGLTGEGLPELVEAVSARMRDSMVAVHVLIPYSQGELVDEIHRTGVVAATEFGAAGTEVRANVPFALAQRLQPLRLQMAEQQQQEQQEQGWEGDGEEGEDEELLGAAAAAGVPRAAEAAAVEQLPT